MKKKIRLTEADIQKIVKKSVNKILKEGSSFPEDYDKWNQIKDALGADAMLDDIFNFLDVDTIQKLIGYFNQDYELFDEEY